jgi:hypothetical protein
MQNHVSRNGKLLLVAAVLAASALVLPSSAVLAATPDQPTGQQAATTDQQAGSFKSSCADQRDWVAAEAGYPGSLLEMARQSLADCEGKQHAAK